VSRCLYGLQFTIPTNDNVRASLDLTTNPALPTLSHSIVHDPLGSAFTIEVNYFNAGCQGTAVFVPPNTLARTITSTSDAGNGLVTSTMKNTLANIKSIGFFVPTPFTNQAQYQYCVEFVLKAVSTGNIIDQERYDVTLKATLDGTVTTGTTVVTDIDTNPAAATFTASVIVCNPATGAVATNNFFLGDTITFCFTSNSFPQASITDITTFKLAVGATSVEVKPSTAGVSSSSTCAVGAGRVATCRLTVVLDRALSVLFLGDEEAESDRAVTAAGVLGMRFGTGSTRRKSVRVLFQTGEDFQRNTETEFVVTTDKEEKDKKCDGFFGWIICILKAIFGFFSGN
jgi:hypothetical protein